MMYPRWAWCYRPDLITKPGADVVLPPTLHTVAAAMQSMTVRNTAQISAVVQASASTGTALQQQVCLIRLAVEWR